MSSRTRSIHVARRASWRPRCPLALVLLASAGVSGAAQFDIVGPAASVQFGTQVVVLPNGNIVVTDPEFQGAKGAVYLYSPAGTQISALVGNSANDRIGSDRIVVLSNGNYVIVSSLWDNGVDAPEAGAITWGSATAGVSGVVTGANSLVGIVANDGGEDILVTALTNGNYVVAFSSWDNGLTVDAGAAVWCNGSTGRIGQITTANALYGTKDSDRVGGSAVVALTNGNYVVPSTSWGNGAVAEAGAVTWGNGTSGTTGPVSATNSLVGSTLEDRIGERVTVLTNGNYVVRSPRWDNLLIPNAGAATWGNGTGGTIGPLTPLNSLVGSQESDDVGDNVLALSNGNYVVGSSQWDNLGVQNVGAATFALGTGGTVGPVTEANSLIGSTQYDTVAEFLTALTNGNYVVGSGLWSDGVKEAVGSSTWGDGTTGTTGVVSEENSLIGNTTFDQAFRVTALSNGNYVVAAGSWDGPGVGQEDLGAVTFGDGASGTAGVISAANSLIGSTQFDQIGRRVVALANGNYVVESPDWDGAGTIDVGAVTWADGTSGLIGVVSAANSLVGSTESDRVGSARALGNGSYVVTSQGWNAGGVEDAGAATWCRGIGPTIGVVSAANSLVGSSTLDYVADVVGGGSKEAQVPPADGSYVLFTPNWDDASSATEDAGAVTLGYGNGDPTGPIIPNNSVLGTVQFAGGSMTPAYDAVRGTLVVGRPASNVVTLFNQKVFGDGFESP